MTRWFYSIYSLTTRHKEIKAARKPLMRAFFIRKAHTHIELA